MNIKRLFNIQALALAFALPALAAPEKIPNDQLQVGKQGSSADKRVTLNINAGANNPEIRSNMTDQDLQLRADTVRAGRPAAGNKVLQFNIGNGATNPALRWNNSTAKIEFTNNGTDFLGIGSGGGSGSGINGIQDNNADFEAGTGSWTVSGGSFTVATSGANLLFGTRSGVFNSSASAQTLTSTGVAVSTGAFSGFAGANGFGSCFFKGSATDYVIEVTDGTNVLASRTIPALTAAQQIGVAFPFPSSGSVFLRIRSQSDAADLAVDNCFLGSTNVFDLSQAKFGTHFEFATANCTGWSRTNTALGSFSPDTDCTAPSVVQGGALTVAATDADLPKWTLSNAPAGTYTIEVTARSESSVGQTRNCIAVNDGTNTRGRVCNAPSGNAAIENTELVSISSWTYTTAGDRTFEVYGLASTGAITLTGSDTDPMQVRISYWPLASEQAFRPDQVAWKVDANIAGANPSLGTGAVTAYTGIENGSLTLTQNAGSIGAQIPCSSTNAPTGTTCAAGNESVGVSFTVPAAGEVRACASFSHILDCAAGSACAIAPVFQLVETPPNAQTILQEGKARVQTGVSINTAQTALVQFSPLRVCGNFNFASAGQKVLRLMYEQTAGAGSFDANSLVADANPNDGQRDIHWEVYPISQAIPAPLLVGSVTSNSAGLERVERAKLINNGSTCTISTQSGSWLSSCVRNSLGDITATIAVSTFSAAPICVPVAAIGSGFQNIRTGTVSSTSVQIQTSGADANIDLICMGPR